MFVWGIVKVGSGGGVGARDGSWVMALDLRPYRDESGALCDAELHLWLPVPDAAAFAVEKARIPKPGTVLTARCRHDVAVLGLGRKCGPHERLLLSYSPGDDAELVAFAAANAPPAEVDVPGVGTFRLDAQLDSYEADVNTAMGAGTLSIEPSDRRAPLASLARAGDLIARVEGMWLTILAAVAHELYETWRDNWADQDAGDDPGMSRKAWCARLVFEGITRFAEEDGCTVWLGDGDLFAGHGIQVSVEADKVTDVCLVG